MAVVLVKLQNLLDKKRKILYLNRRKGRGEVIDLNFAQAGDQIIDAIMNKTQKTLLVTAAIAGLVAGAVAKANANGNAQNQDVAGKQVSTDHATPNGCNGCGGGSKTNSVTAN